MDELDIVLESYETTSEIYRSDMENSIVCESLFLPAEEGLVDTVKKTVTAIYDNFKRLVAAFKKWVKSIIARIKAFFRKGKKKDEPAPDTDSSDSKSSEPSSVKVTQEDVKEDVSKLQNIIKQADAVEASLKKASTGEVTPEEAKDLNKQADDAASEMKEAKKTMEVKYLMLPAKSESGNTKDTETDQSLEERHNNYLKALNDSKDSEDPTEPTESDFAGMDKVVSEIAAKDPFKLGDYADYKDRGMTWQFISRCGEIEAGGKKSFGWIKASVGELVRRILRVTDSENPKYKSAQLMLSYMQSRIPSKLQKYINSNKNQVAKLKKGLANTRKKPLDKDKEWDAFSKAMHIESYAKDIFEGEPNMQNLKKYINAKEQTKQS